MSMVLFTILMWHDENVVENKNLKRIEKCASCDQRNVEKKSRNVMACKEQGPYGDYYGAKTGQIR